MCKEVKPASGCTGPSSCSVLNAELLDHIKGMRLYYSGPMHQPSPRCVCRGCIDEKIHKWSQSQNASGQPRLADTTKEDDHV